MVVKRIISTEERVKIRTLNFKEYKGKDVSTLTRAELDDLIVKISKKLGIL